MIRNTAELTLTVILGTALVSFLAIAPIAM
jgi:hypothetical protein